MNTQPEWINDQTIVSLAALHLNIPQGFTLVVTPTQMIICRPDGATYQSTTDELLQTAATHIVGSDPSPAADQPVAETVEDTAFSPSQFIFESPQPTEHTSPPPEVISPPSPPRNDFPTVDELVVDLDMTFNIQIPSVSIVNGDATARLRDLHTQLIQEQRRHYKDKPRALHLAALLGQIQSSHPSSFRRFLNNNFDKQRERRRFSLAVYRTHRLAKHTGLGRLLDAQLMTFPLLKRLTEEDFEKLLRDVQPEPQLLSDSEDFVINEGAL